MCESLFVPSMLTIRGLVFNMSSPIHEVIKPLVVCPLNATHTALQSQPLNKPEAEPGRNVRPRPPPPPKYGDTPNVSQKLFFRNPSPGGWVLWENPGSAPVLSLRPPNNILSTPLFCIKFISTLPECSGPCSLFGPREKCFDTSVCYASKYLFPSLSLSLSLSLSRPPGSAPALSRHRARVSPRPEPAPRPLSWHHKRRVLTRGVG